MQFGPAMQKGKKMLWNSIQTFYLGLASYTFSIYLTTYQQTFEIREHEIPLKIIT
jgi:hypothetical protein